MSVLAVSGQQAIGLGVAAALVVGWVIYLAVNAAKPDKGPGSEIENAPNRKPYLNDEQLEGPKLDRALTWGLIVLAFVAIGLPVYWLAEPGRQANAEIGFDKRSVARGAELFQSAQSKLAPGHIAAGCADCHGNAGQGGTVAFVLQGSDPTNPEKIVPVQWEAPALNTVLKRFDEGEVKQIIIYGRPPTPMPAWGVEGGGALGDQQVNDLVAFLKSIQISDAKAKAEGKQYGTDGQALFNAYCARCHTLGWSYRDSYQEPNAPSGGGAYGPNLRDGDTLRQFPDPEKHIEFITDGSEGPPVHPAKNYGRRGVGTGRMPGFGRMLTKEQIEAIVAYERSL